jgi:lipopolysaccharide/colanic/teichoic acid biosynthesis glycosyltransferase
MSSDGLPAASCLVQATDLGPWEAPLVRPYLGVKTVLDLALAAILLVLTSPLLIAAALLVKLTTPGSAFYAQIRAGRGGRPYTMYKIRTMFDNCEHSTGAKWATTDDPRVTWAGHFLRRTHIDELPQLLNVLRLEMSLVGPRPERPEIIAQLGEALPGYAKRMWIRPGLTGLAQIQLPSDINLESVRRKLAYDHYYVDRFGLGLDLRILLATASNVAGLPFSWTRKVLRIPGEKTIEVDSYPPAESRVGFQLQLVGPTLDPQGNRSGI